MKRRAKLPGISPQERAQRRIQLKRSKRASIFAFFVLALFVGVSSASTQDVWTGVEKIIAVGDLHGDYDNFVKILKGTKIVDNALHWAAGKTHFVQNGDIMDRGPEARKIFDLLMNLEKEAEAAGGKVHMLIGNHEEMNITGIVFRYPGYMTPDQFRSFLPDGYKKKQDGRLQKMMRDLHNDSQRGSLISVFWNKLENDLEAQSQYLTFFNENYGLWILKHNAVIKINDIVFVHGGIGEKFSTWKIEDINDRLRRELSELARKAVRNEPHNTPLEIAYNADGPLWYRDLATVPQEDLKEEVDRILANLGAKAMVIAHTPKVPTRQEMERFGGKVWIVDTGISFVYGGRLSALIIKDGKFEIWPEEDPKEELNRTLANLLSALIIEGSEFKI